jgi:hypothetical protein
MTFEISTKARNVVGFERAEDIHRIPLFIEVTAGPAKDGVKVLLGLAFQRIEVSAPHSWGPWFAAASDARLTIQTDHGTIGDCTDTTYVTAEITEEDTVEKSFEPEFKPELKLSEKTSISIGSIGGKKATTSTRTRKFSGRKGDVSVTKLASSVVWDGLKGLNESAIGSSLAGNIKLWANCEWPKQKGIGTGSVELRSFYDFFTDDGKKLSLIKSFFASVIADLKPDVLETEKTRVDFRVRP